MSTLVGNQSERDSRFSRASGLAPVTTAGYMLPPRILIDLLYYVCCDWLWLAKRYFVNRNTQNLTL